MINEYGRIDNLTGRVLTIGFLLNQSPSDSVTASITREIQGLDNGEWDCLKHYISTGSFL